MPDRKNEIAARLMMGLLTAAGVGIASANVQAINCSFWCSSCYITYMQCESCSLNGCDSVGWNCQGACWNCNNTGTECSF